MARGTAARERGRHEEVLLLVNDRRLLSDGVVLIQAECGDERALRMSAGVRVLTLTPRKCTSSTLKESFESQSQVHNLMRLLLIASSN